MKAGTLKAVKAPVESSVKPLTDAQILRWLRDNMEWDGHGYWLPEICIRERERGEKEFFPEPTMSEFRSALSDKAREA